MQGLLRTAEQLKIKGLCDVNDQTSSNGTAPNKRSRIKRSRSPDTNQFSRERKTQELPSIHKVGLNNGPNSLVILEHREVPRTAENKDKTMASLGMGLVSYS